jgi:hypothetical protein
VNATGKGYGQIVALLLRCGAHPLIQNDFGESAYDVAAAAEQVDICLVLEKSEQKWLKESQGA